MTAKEMMLKIFEESNLEYWINSDGSIEIQGNGYNTAMFEFNEEGKLINCYA